jgi:hypothetical protein
MLRLSRRLSVAARPLLAPAMLKTRSSPRPRPRFTLFYPSPQGHYVPWPVPCHLMPLPLCRISRTSSALFSKLCRFALCPSPPCIPSASCFTLRGVQQIDQVETIVGKDRLALEFLLSHSPGTFNVRRETRARHQGSCIQRCALACPPRRGLLARHLATSCGAFAYVQSA